MSEPVRALIVDDEPLARRNISILLARHSRWLNVGERSTGRELATVVAEAQADVVFLDVRMPGASGISVGRNLVAGERPPLLIFTTAFHQHAVDAFDLDAVDYLLKPIDAPRFDQAVSRAESRLMRAGDTRSDALARGVSKRIVIPTSSGVRFVDANDIVWIAAAGNYVQIYLADVCILHRATLASLAADLASEHFLQVHRSTIVNVDQVVELVGAKQGPCRLRLRDGACIDVSHRYRTRVLRRLGARS